MTLLAKIILLVFMLSDRPMLKLTHMTCQYEPNIGEHCPTVTLIYFSCGIRYKPFNLSYGDSNKDVYFPVWGPYDGRRSLVWDKTIHVWYDNEASQDSETMDGALESFMTVVCGDWYYKSLPVLEFALWFLMNCAPQIISSLAVLSLTCESEHLFSLLTSYPQVLLSPVICNLSFTKNGSEQLVLSKSLTWANLVIFILGYFFSVWIIWDRIKVFPRPSGSDNMVESLIPILFFSSVFLNILFLHHPHFETYDDHFEKEYLSHKGKGIRYWSAWGFVLFPVILFILQLTIESGLPPGTLRGSFCSPLD